MLSDTLKGKYIETSRILSPDDRAAWREYTGQEPPKEITQPTKAEIKFDCSACGIHKIFSAEEYEVSDSPLNPNIAVTLKAGEKLIRWQERNCPRIRRGRMKLVK
jgi:hypothetical protein